MRFGQSIFYIYIGNRKLVSRSKVSKHPELLIFVYKISSGNIESEIGNTFWRKSVTESFFLIETFDAAMKKSSVYFSN